MKATSLIVVLALLGTAACSKKHDASTDPPSQGPQPSPADSTSTGANAAATNDPSGDLSGEYTIKSASNPGGKGSYRGAVQLTKKSGYYDMAWTIAGSSGYKGVAIQDGNLLGVGWGQGGDFGVVVYKIEGGKLTGSWTSRGAGGVGTEDLEGPATLGGSYKITKATTPEGKTYAGDVTITPKGATYLIHWKLAGGDTYDGAAIKQDDRLIVGWGRGGRGAGVVSYTVQGSKLDGKWATAGGGDLGTEVLSK